MNIVKIALLGGVGLASAAAGIFLPTIMSGGQGTDAAAHKPADAGHAPKDAHAAKDDHGKKDDHGHGSGHDAKKEAKPDAHGGGHGVGHGGHGEKVEVKVIKEGPVYLPFEQVLVNLNEPNLVKYLSIDIAVQTDGKYEDEVKAALVEKKAVLKTFLTSHLADKSVEDIRGRVGVNQLRREIQDGFNAALFKDGHERISDILFEEYHVQQ